MVNYLIALVKTIELIAGGVIFYFFLVPAVLGMLRLPRLAKQPQWRLVIVALLLFCLWRIFFWGALPGSLSVRYALATGIPLLLLVAPGVTRLFLMWQKRVGWNHLYFWLAVIMLLGVTNLAKSCRMPKTKSYLPEIATLLKPYEKNGLCIDGSRELARLSFEYDCRIPLQQLLTDAERNDPDCWIRAIDRNIDQTEHLFIVHEFADGQFTKMLQDRLGKVPVETMASWKFRGKQIVLEKVTSGLNADWATPGRSHAVPNPAGLSLPGRIALPQGKTLNLQWSRVVGDENWRNYVYSVECPLGFLYADGYYYRCQTGDPAEFRLTVIMRDANGLEVARQPVLISNVAADAGESSIPEAGHFRVPPPEQSDFKPMTAVPEVLFARPGKMRIYLDPWLTMPDPERFQWQLEGIASRPVRDHFRGVELEMPTHPVTVRLQLHESGGPVKTGIPLRLEPVPPNPRRSDAGLVVISSGIDNAPGGWKTRVGGDHLLEIRDWPHLRQKLESGEWRDSLSRADTVIVDIPYYNTNLMPGRAQIRTVIALLRAAAPGAKIIIAAPPASAGSQDAWAIYANQFRNNYFSDWEYRRKQRQLILDMQSSIAAERENRPRLVFAFNIGEKNDFPQTMNPVPERLVTGNYFLLSPQGRGKMIEALLLAAEIKEPGHE
ncbi:MAG: hypothetical protein AB7F32_01400 [Victivallaceae bacterium]